MSKLSKMHQRVIDKHKGVNIVNNDDLKIPKNEFWDIANKHYEDSIKAIARVEGEIARHLESFVKVEGNTQLLENPKIFADNINLLNKDLQEHVQELDKIHELHKDKRGTTTSINDHMLVLDIQGKYAEKMEVYEANIIPTVAHILEDISKVEKILIERNQLLDTTIVTDVVDKTQLN